MGPATAVPEPLLVGVNVTVIVDVDILTGVGGGGGGQLPWLSPVTSMLVADPVSGYVPDVFV